jgi:signal transduction histidine kinase
MPPLPDLPRRHAPWRTALLVLSICVGIALLLTAFDRGNFGKHLAYSLSIGGACWLFVDGGRLLAARGLARWRNTRGLPPCDADHGWPGWGWMGAVIALGMPVGVAGGMLLGDRLTGHRSPSLLDWASPGTQTTVVISLLATLVAVGLITTLEKAASARVEAEAAQRQAAEHRLRLLEAQLEPHMLFNTLANLRALIAVDPPRAQAMLDRVIAYLRATLGASRTSMHPLAAEFARLDDYLALMAVRMGARLQVTLDLPQALRDYPVPALLLQPLAENAIKHGLEPKVAGGRLEVRARADAARLVLAVRDTGVGIGALPHGGSGFGCEQVRERLATLYGDAASLAIEPAADAEGGTLATIELPLSGAAVGGPDPR